MCKLCASENPNRILLTRQPPSAEELIAALATAFADVLRDYHESITVALQDGVFTLTSAEVVKTELRRILDGEYREAWDLVLEDMWVDGGERGREAHIRRHGLGVSYDITRDAVYRALRENAARDSELIQSRMTGDLGDALAEAYDEGHSIDEMTETLQEDVFPTMREYEARRVSRTSVIGGSNRGALTAYRDDDSVTGKTWLATDGPRTRTSHRRADNQTVPIDGEFTVGTELADYPGDPTLSPSQRVNCRCSILPSLG